MYSIGLLQFVYNYKENRNYIIYRVHYPIIVL